MRFASSVLIGLVLLLAAGVASACQATIRVQRTDSTVGVLYSVKPAVQVKGGWLKQLDTLILNKAGTVSKIVTLDLGCKAQRHWQFTVTRTQTGKPTKTEVVHYPQGDFGFTTDLDIHIGDVSKLF